MSEMVEELDSGTDYMMLSLTDDQKVMEQSYCGSHLYQDIDDDSDVDHDHDSDDYECIDEIKAAVTSDINDVEWRVLSRLSCDDVGEDWRIVSSMPRNKNKFTRFWQDSVNIVGEEFKEKCKMNADTDDEVTGEVSDDGEHLSIIVTNNVNNVAPQSESCSHAKSFLERLLTRPGEDSHHHVEEQQFVKSEDQVNTSNTPGWLRKQVSFGKLFVSS